METKAKNVATKIHSFELSKSSANLSFEISKA